MSNPLYNLIIKESKEIDLAGSMIKFNDDDFKPLPEKGEVISGLIKFNGQEKVLDILGREVSVQNSLLEDSQIGETKTFEVVNIKKELIELRLNDPSIEESESSQGFIAVMRLEQDKDLHMLSRSYNDKKVTQQEELLRTRQMIEDILMKLTEKDIEEIEKEGVAIENYSIEGLSRIIDRIKGKTQARESLKEETDWLGIERADKEYIEKVLIEENIPATKEVIGKIIRALSIYKATEDLDNKSIEDLLRLELPPTIENLYKISYISKQEIGQGKNLSEKDWEELKNQVIKTLEKANMEVSQSNIEKSKRLIENNIPVSKSSLNYYDELEEIIGIYKDEKKIFRHIINSIKDGADPKDTVLSKQEDYEKIVEEIKSIKEETILHAVEREEELNIKTLKELQSKEIDTKRVREINRESIRALRQMEEIRLKMTADAALRLEKKGIRINYQPLERLVEELRDLEKNHYKEILEEAEVETSDNNIGILKETSYMVEELRSMPEFILGKTIEKASQHTIKTLYDAYENLKTVPSPEYGDSIQKAFKNIDLILEEMEIPNTKANQKAIRILGYNNMEITRETIEEVKAYELEVSSLINNLHPSTTVRLIKEGINPLEIPINELNQLIYSIQKKLMNGDIEKYSVFLQKLDKQGDISPEERKSYIGIYRLLHSIEKTDGAALGAVIKAGKQVTLSHLLTAVRTFNKGRIDAEINDDFGGLDQLNYKGESITDQIDAAYASPRSFLSQALQIMYKEIEPGVFSDYGNWEAIKDRPVEELFDKFLQDPSRGQDLNSREKLVEIQEIIKNSNQEIQFLNNIKLPSSAANIAVVNQLLSSEQNLYKKLWGLKEEKTSKKLKKTLKKIEETTDTVFDRETLQEIYRDMDHDISQALEEEVFTGTLDAKRLAEIKSIHMQLSFVRELAEREFYQIPILTEEGISNINLTILRQKERTGRVSVHMDSHLLGNVRIELILKDNQLKGYIGSDNRSGLDLLKANMIELEKAAEEGQVTLGKVEVSLIEKKGITGLNHIYNDEASQSSQSNVREQQLYLIAKGIVKTIRALEKTKKN